MLLRVTVVRVFPTCEVVGRFRVRGRAGVNRVPFRGRLHGRPLANGTYRLVIAARSAHHRSEATIVIARRKVSAARLGKARRANACVPVIGFDWTAPGLFSSGPTDGGAATKVEKAEKGIAAPLMSGAKGAVKEGKALVGRAKEALENSDPPNTLLVVAVAMLLTLATAVLGLVLLANLQRLRERHYR